MFFTHALCFFKGVVSYISVIWLYVYVFAILPMVHCGSVFEPGASWLPYYCTPPVCIPDVLGALAVWRFQKKKRLGLGATKDLLSLHPLLCFCNAICCMGGIWYKRRVVAVDDKVKSFWFGRRYCTLAP